MLQHQVAQRADDVVGRCRANDVAHQFLNCMHDNPLLMSADDYAQALASRVSANSQNASNAGGP